MDLLIWVGEGRNLHDLIRHSDETLTMERLDGVVANHKWLFELGN